MVAMATQLRAGAEAMTAALHDRDRALDRASQGLLQSVTTVQKRVVATRKSVRRSRRSIWKTLLLLLAVAAVCLGACPSPPAVATS